MVCRTIFTPLSRPSPGSPQPATPSPGAWARQPSGRTLLHAGPRSLCQITQAPIVGLISLGSIVNLFHSVRHLNAHRQAAVPLCAIAALVHACSICAHVHLLLPHLSRCHAHLRLHVFPKVPWLKVKLARGADTHALAQPLVHCLACHLLPAPGDDGVRPVALEDLHVPAQVVVELSRALGAPRLHHKRHAGQGGRDLRLLGHKRREAGHNALVH
mmetsp:Transcript_28468/g.73107  ORF Transcript_28468/g.73107 Transcript_28468/m.73107 type:complete len:215 (+) Transcript_28468:189-833(+)